MTQPQGFVKERHEFKVCQFIKVQTYPWVVPLRMSHLKFL